MADPTRKTQGDMVGYGDQPRPIRRGWGDTSAPGPARAMNAQETGGSGMGGTGGGGGGSTIKTVRRAVAPSSTGVDLRQLFTGATLKKIIGLPHVIADIVLAKISSPAGGVLTAIANDRSDVYVGFQDLISNIFGIARLFAPGNILWRLPKKGDSAMVIKPSEADGTGIPYALYGDGGAANQVPAWLSSGTPGDCGIAAIENVHLESANSVMIKAASGAQSQSGQDTAFTSNIKLSGTDGHIEINGATNAAAAIQLNSSSGASIVLNGGALNVARVTDQVQGMAGPYPIVNGLISGPGATFVKA